MIQCSRGEGRGENILIVSLSSPKHILTLSPANDSHDVVDGHRLVAGPVPLAGERHEGLVGAEIGRQGAVL